LLAARRRRNPQPRRLRYTRCKWILFAPQCRFEFMPGIPDPVIEQIRAASDIVDVIGAYIPLKRAGTNFTALCPFHKEKTPSFNVTPHKQIFHCFGCHKGGDVFKFVQEYENIGFMDAVRRLADRAHITIEVDNNPAAAQSRHVKDQLLTLHEQITQRWQTALVSDAGAQIARDYLAKRGVSEEAIKLFRIGYAPDAWDDTVHWSRGKNFDIKLVEQAGLVVRKEGSDHFYDRFRGRLMFPICDEQGRVVAFSGRILSGDEKIAKYVNSPETPIFTKGKTFFGLDKSKRAILDAKSAIVCEGQLDLIACFMSGVKNIVAPQGTALTADHARILKRYADEVVLCFDADNAGQNAAVRALDSLLAAGFAIRVATVPSPHDPDSFIKEFGADAFQDRIKNAEGFFDWYLDRLCKTNDLTTDRGRLAVVQAMLQALHKTNSTILLDTYAQATAIRLGIDPNAVRAEFKKGVRTTPQPTHREESVTQVREPLPKPPVEEWWLVRLLLETDEFVEWTAQHLDQNWITHRVVREIVNARFEALLNGTWSGVAAMLTASDNPEWQTLISEVLADGRTAENSEEILKGTPTKHGAVQKLRGHFIDQQISALNQRVLRKDLSDEDKFAAMAQANELRKLKTQPLVPITAI
jgi:DNA primase